VFFINCEYAKMPQSEFYIRKAEPEDVDTILQLIIALATYEKEPNSVKATPQLVKSTGPRLEYHSSGLMLTIQTAQEKPV